MPCSSSSSGLLRPFSLQVVSSSARPAVVEGSLSLTYADLNAQANRLAHRLIREGVRPGSMVGLHLSRSAAYVRAVLAILRSGATYVPLGTDWPEERIAFLARDAGLTLVLTNEPESAALRGLTCPKWVPHSDDDGPSAPPEVDTSSQPAYVMFTSGSTGHPKGVVVPQRAILRLCSGDYLPWGPERRFLLLAPLSFDASTFELWGALLHGGACVVHPEEKVTLEGLRTVLREQEIDCLWLTAGLFNQVIDEDPSILAPVRHLLTGGETLSVPHVRRALAALPEVRLINGYGPTEATTFTCTYLIPRDQELGLSIPIGRPLPRTVCRVLDEHQQPILSGTAGELCIGGEAIADGYLNRPELSAEKFVTDPLDSSGRLYRSGDLVRERPDGNFEFLGRLDDQIKIRGFRIEPGEVESALASLPGIQRVAVAARTGADGWPELVAYLVMTPDADLTQSALRAALAERLPPYLLPDWFGVVDSLPLTVNGKVDRARLVAGPVRELPLNVDPREEPCTVLEVELAGLWQRELGRSGVGRHDRFADLGGHSLRALRVVARIRERWGVPLTLAEFLSDPTVAGLAACVTEAQKLSPVPLIVPIPRGQPLPLTGEQMGLWYLHHQGPDPAAYHVSFAWRLDGVLDRARLEAAWQRVVERHEVLRTRLVLMDGVPHQEVVASGPWRIAWEEQEGVVKTDALEAELREEARAPFALERAPLWRWRGWRLGDTGQILQLTLHHVIVDEWSLRRLLEDLAAGYAAPGTEVPALPALPVQFADFAAWQMARLERPEAEVDRRFWSESLAGSTGNLELPFDRPATGRPTGAGGRVVFRLSAAVRQTLEQLARKAGTTGFVTALSAFQALLARWSGEDDFVVGTPLAQRSEPGLEAVAGYFLNTLPIRLAVDPATSVESAVGAVREAVHQAFAHGSLPLDQMVRAAGRARRDAGSVPLFNVMFVLLEDTWPDLQLPGLTSSPMPVETGTSKVDLTLFLTDDGAGGWRAELEFAADRFSTETARLLAGQVEPFFAGFSADSHRLVGDVPLLAETVPALTLRRPVGTDEEEQTLDRPFAAQAARSPEHPALIVGDRVLTYRQLAHKVGSLARRLRGAGVQPDDRVALLLPRTEPMLVAILGTLQAGAGYVPLDGDVPPERLAHLLADAQPRLVVTTAAWQSRLPADGPLVLSVESAEAMSGDWLEPVAEPEHLAYLIYTSGSTGRSKGVMVEHRQVASLFEAVKELIPPHPQARWLATTHYTFDISVFELLWPLVQGQTLVLFRGDAADETIPRLLVRHGITHFQCTPSRARALLLDPEAPAALRGLQTLILTGEPLPPDLVVQLGPMLSGTLLNLYGPTETTIWSTGTALVPGNNDVHIGRALANTAVAVVDAALRPLPPGLPGELLIGGRAVARGYWEQPGRTAESFVVPSFAPSPGQRWYRTGDRVRWRPDGNLQYLGRRDFQVKLRGYRIEPGEIEAVLRTHPTVEQAVVVVREDAGRDPELVAYLTAGGSERPGPEVLRRFLVTRLSSWLIPTRWSWLDHLPLTTSGKINRRALPAPASEPDEAPLPSDAAPTPMEKRLAAVWARVLGQPAVGLHRDFFDLGGHSLLALRLVAAMQLEFRRPVTLAQLLQHPTVAQLAPLLAVSAESTPTVRPTAFRGQDEGAPFFLVPGLFGYEFLAPSLAEVVGRYRPYFDALQLPGLDGRSTPCDRVEELADDIVRQIHGLHPQGALCLTGNSFGGLVAFETARRLTAVGRRVEAVVLFDSTLGHGGRRRSWPELVGVVARRFWRRPRGQRLAYLQMLLSNKFAPGRWYVPPEETRNQKEALTPEVEAVVAASQRAAAQFQAQLYPGRVILFRATELYDHVYLRRAPDPRNGWGEVAQGDFQILHFACRHHELFQEPVFPEVRHRLDELLRTGFVPASP